MNNALNLLPSLIRLAQLQGASCDRLALTEAVESQDQSAKPKVILQGLGKHLHLSSAKWMPSPDPSQLPVLLHSKQGEWGILRGVNAQGLWVSEQWNADTNGWNELQLESLADYSAVSINLRREYTASKSPVLSLVRDEILSQKRPLMEAILGGIVINIVALATSFYTMQVYDRVVPTGASATLMVLSIGVGIAILYELIAKMVRTRLFDRVISRTDLILLFLPLLLIPPINLF